MLFFTCGNLTGGLNQLCFVSLVGSMQAYIKLKIHSVLFYFLYRNVTAVKGKVYTCTDISVCGVTCSNVFAVLT